MASTGKHPGNCERAKGHVCRCGNCGGSQHGWGGWIGLAREPEQVRVERRSSILGKLAERWSAKRGAKLGKRADETIMDLVRIDCTVWLAREKDGWVALPGQRRGTETVAGGPYEDRRSPARDDVRDELADDLPSADAGREPSPEATSDRPGALDQVNAFARAMTEEIWQDIVAELPGTPEEIRRIRLQLADHGWCDLFIGVVRVLERFGKAFDEIPDRAKKIIVKTIRRSSRGDKRPALTKFVVNLIVDKAWAAFKAALIAHSPVFGVLTSEELLRNLRMIALFICPAPERHEEVRKHALEPLADDAQGYVSDAAKEWLAKQFGLRPAGEIPAARETPA
jgi:hypothetical protein